MAIRRRLMAEQWDEFARSVLPATCSPIQRRAMRRAFYAGGQAIMFRVIQSLSAEGEPTPADLKVMEDLHGELNDFAQSVRDGVS